MIPLVALPVVASWAVVLSVLGLIGWATVGRLMAESARIDAGIAQVLAEVEDEEWLRSLHSDTPVHDRLAVGTYRRQVAGLPEVDR